MPPPDPKRPTDNPAGQKYIIADNFYGPGNPKFRIPGMKNTDLIPINIPGM